MTSRTVRQTLKPAERRLLRQLLTETWRVEELRWLLRQRSLSPEVVAVIESRLAAVEDTTLDGGELHG
jgi:hypothetical protein